MKKLLLFILLFGGTLFAQCPIQITHIRTHARYTTATLTDTIVIHYKNVSTKEIQGVRFKTATVDGVGDVHDEYGSMSASHKLKPGKDRYDAWSYIAPESKVIAWPDKVLFTDGTAWEGDGTHACSEEGKYSRF